MSAASMAFLRQCEEKDEHCWICDGRIEYWDRTYWNRDTAFSRDHYWPISLRPDLKFIVSNWRSSHRLCNNRRSSRTPEQTVWIGDIYTGRWQDETNEQYDRRTKREAEHRGVAWPYPMMEDV